MGAAVVFHNGDPFTAEDVKFSLERAIADNPRTSIYAALNTIERVELLDPCTVNLATRHPDPLLPTRLSYFSGVALTLTALSFNRLGDWVCDLTDPRLRRTE
jgi:ABC-type transport system substrate-binding protein